ncbi:MAG: universal stress protein [Novosphingobium sp.]|nr:universal stress protein [Novosphingobium sp.]
MTVRDILLYANTHPEPTPDWAIDRVAELAERLGAQASLCVCQVRFPSVSNWLANKLLAMDDTIAGENRKSAANADNLARTFEARVPAGQLGGAFVVECPGIVPHWQLAVRARTHDLSIVPVHGHAETVSVAEGLIFESGRPVLLLPEIAGRELRFDRIAIAWDGSSVAARALGDAMPLVRQAGSVALVQITGEKDLSKAASSADAVRNLKFHGIDAEAVEIPLEGRDAAATLQSWCERDGRELLVMGAFGHSRAREFVLGGVTRSILASPRLPVLISH